MDISAADLADDAARITAATLDCARLIAAERVVRSAKAGGVTVPAPATLAAVLARRETSDPAYQAVAGFEQAWALLVIQLTDSANRTPPVADAQAVADARLRGVTWQAIGDALGGISQQAAQGRYAYAARVDVTSRRRRASSR